MSDDSNLDALSPHGRHGGSDGSRSAATSGAISAGQPSRQSGFSHNIVSSSLPGQNPPAHLLYTAPKQAWQYGAQQYLAQTPIAAQHAGQAFTMGSMAAALPQLPQHHSGPQYLQNVGSHYHARHQAPLPDAAGYHPFTGQRRQPPSSLPGHEQQAMLHAFEGVSLHAPQLHDQHGFSPASPQPYLFANSYEAQSQPPFLSPYNLGHVLQGGQPLPGQIVGRMATDRGLGPAVMHSGLPTSVPGGKLSAGQAGFAQAGFMPTGWQPAASTSLTPRGPPRKPKQSGHALWVGNLPPGTTVTSLKEHFSRGMKDDIESIFLISKSNCAFVNYKSGTALLDAMKRFDESRFNGVRLVCRLRRGSASALTGNSDIPAIPMGPTQLPPGLVDGQTQELEGPSSTPAPDEEDTGAAKDVEAVREQQTGQGSKDRYFIVKSLTTQDLDTSLRTGIWATQSHNESVLNDAFKNADHVYLVFSANKSGSYFGYARMASSISSSATQLLGSAASREETETSDTPRTIPTPETECAPRGRIIDDSARGTIFWEADNLSESEKRDKERREMDENGEEEGGGGESEASQDQSWGKPFRVEWLSTARVPFYRTRGMRNPLNANREIKIARDGTELEGAIGRKLLEMFHKTAGGARPTTSGVMSPAVQGTPPSRDQ